MNFGADNGVANQTLYLYAHWHGSALPDLLRAALLSPESRNRRGDPPYQARILTTQIIHAAKGTLEETGWGLSPYFCDSEHPVLVVDLEHSRISLRTAANKGDKSRWLSFDEFCALSTLGKLDWQTVEQAFD